MHKPAGGAAGDEGDERGRGRDRDPAVTTAAREPRDAEPIRRRLIGDAAVAHLDQLGLAPPGRHAAAASGCVASQASTAPRRSAGQFAVHVGVELVFCHNGSRSIIDFLSLSFHAAQRRALAVQIRSDLHAGAREPRHHRADRHALHLGDLAIGQTLQARQAAAPRAAPRRDRRARGQCRGRPIPDRPSQQSLSLIGSQHRTPRQAPQPVAIEIGQDGVEPCPNVAAVRTDARNATPAPAYPARCRRPSRRRG